MERYIKPIGGEHWFTLELFNKENNNFENTKGTFLSGGQSAIRFILDDIGLGENDYLLMPAYLCSTILYALQEKSIKYDFYNIKKDLSLDLIDLEKKIEERSPKAVFFIDYFGFYHNDKTTNFINNCKSKGIIIIEDAVQMFWFKEKKFIGDYIFNSFRKFLPIDGSIVISSKVKQYNWIDDTYYNLVNKARMDKTLYAHYNIGKEMDYLNLFKLAEEEYYTRKNIIGIDKNSLNMLSKVDEKYISLKRIENYRYLSDKLQNISNIEVLYDKEKISDNVPLGLPIFISNRDSVRRYLASKSIFCPVHWNIEQIDYKGRIFNESIEISRNILTLPIDHRYDFDDLDKIITNISYILDNI